MSSPFLSIEELEIGLLSLDEGDVDLRTFWDQNIHAFRQTVLLAIRETSDALLSPRITLRWRIELESQLDDLLRYIRLADRYIVAQALACPDEFPRPGGSRTH